MTPGVIFALFSRSKVFPFSFSERIQPRKPFCRDAVPPEDTSTAFHYLFPVHFYFVFVKNAIKERSIVPRLLKTYSCQTIETHKSHLNDKMMATVCKMLLSPAYLTTEGKTFWCLSRARIVLSTRAARSKQRFFPL